MCYYDVKAFIPLFNVIKIHRHFITELIASEELCTDLNKLHYSYISVPEQLKLIVNSFCYCISQCKICECCTQNSVPGLSVRELQISVQMISILSADKIYYVIILTKRFCHIF